jgi:hypothetical protein
MKYKIVSDNLLNYILAAATAIRCHPRSLWNQKVHYHVGPRLSQR